MGSSWGHAVEALSDEQREFYAGHGWTCAAGKCGSEATHYTIHHYITGRAGRASYAKRRACPVYAARFAAKHGLTFEGGGRDDD